MKRGAGQSRRTTGSAGPRPLSARTPPSVEPHLPPPSLRSAMALYDSIGVNYARSRREDPRIAAALHAALGDARTVLNVGAGAGSYEPRDRWCLAVEPSDVMAAQRPVGHAPALRGTAAALPLRDKSVDAAMTVVSLHHWGDDQERGVRELRRVARGPVVILTYDPVICGEMWLFAEYMPEVREADTRMFPSTARLDAWLGGGTRITAVPLHRDCEDWMLGSYWAHPERVLDPEARAATSGIARLAPEVQARIVAEVGRDLADGTWERRHGHLRALTELDVGLRLLVSPG